MFWNIEFDDWNALSAPHTSPFLWPEIVRELSRLRENFVKVSADKASYDFLFVCKESW